jgi:hypothetical protein
VQALLGFGKRKDNLPDGLTIQFLALTIKAPSHLLVMFSDDGSWNARILQIVIVQKLHLIFPSKNMLNNFWRAYFSMLLLLQLLILFFDDFRGGSLSLTKENRVRDKSFILFIYLLHTSCQPIITIEHQWHHEFVIRPTLNTICKMLCEDNMLGIFLAVFSF